MWAGFQSFAAEAGLLVSGVATGIAITVVIIAPNVSFDRLDGQRANGHVRALVRTGSPIVGSLYVICAILFLAGESYGAGSLSGLAAFGFFSNLWTLAPSKRVKGVSVSGREKSKRIVAMSLSIMFTLAGIIAGVIGIWNL